MAERCLLYYITDRRAFPGDESARRQRLLEKIGEAARAGVEYIQLREKDLSGRELESLGREAVSVLAQLRTEHRKVGTILLINSRTDVAMVAHADGVHLRADDVSPQDVRMIWKEAGVPASHTSPVIGVSCHSVSEVTRMAAAGADFAVFAPVFEKRDAPTTRPAGLAMLREACQASIRVLALGGVTLSNARSCLDAGAAGIAGIRLFQEGDVAEIVRQLRG